MEQLRIPFRICVPDVSELGQGQPSEVALENSRRKAHAVSGQRGGTELLVAVDTLVALDGRVYGKPEDAGDARRMLEALRGREHHVLGGLTLVIGDAEHSLVAATAVRFRNFSDDLLQRYIARGEWRERAGGYAIQGTGAALVSSTDGDYLNVVGFPVAAFLDLLAGMDIRGLVNSEG